MTEELTYYERYGRKYSKTEKWKEGYKRYIQSPKGRMVINRANKAFRDNNRKRLLEILGNKCVICGFDDFRALQLDHVNGKGNQQRKKFGTGDVMIAYYLKHIDEAKIDLQILCANHNWIKRFEKNENRPIVYHTIA